LTFRATNLIYESRCDLFEIANFDVKGESIDEERNQESCEEEGRSEEEREVAASLEQHNKFC
jgi:hypothetical protein